MIKLLNRSNGAEMWVDPSRVGEYLAAGHKPAVEVPEAPPKPEPAKTIRKGRATKK